MKKEFKLSTRESYTEDGVRSIEPIEAQVIVNCPNGEKPKKLTKEDVWGEFDVYKGERISNGMVVARYKDICPIFNDEVPYKSVTVVCREPLGIEIPSFYFSTENNISIPKNIYIIISSRLD